MAASNAVLMALSSVPCSVQQSPTMITSVAQSSKALATSFLPRTPRESTKVSQGSSYFSPLRLLTSIPFSVMPSTFVWLMIRTFSSSNMLWRAMMFIFEPPPPVSLALSISTTVTFLPCLASIRAVSNPVIPAPAMMTVLPVCTSPLSTSPTQITLLPQSFANAGIIGSEPMAMIATSNFSSLIISGVASVASLTAILLLLRVVLTAQATYFLMSFLNSGVLPKFRVPPKELLASYKVTLCPLSAAVLAASIPAGPPPITATFLLDAGRG